MSPFWILVIIAVVANAVTSALRRRARRAPRLDEAPPRGVATPRPAAFRPAAPAGAAAPTPADDKAPTLGEVRPPSPWGELSRPWNTLGKALRELERAAHPQPPPAARPQAAPAPAAEGPPPPAATPPPAAVSVSPSSAVVDDAGARFAAALGRALGRDVNATLVASLALGPPRGAAWFTRAAVGAAARRGAARATPPPAG